jgi:NAD(P) transhydrogenase
LHGQTILIATGSAPVHPPIFPFGPGVYDSDTILQLDRLPRTLAVVGAGAIGSEYACTFAALGSHVHVIDGRNVLLPYLDTEVSRALTTVMERNGIVFHWKDRALSCAAPGPSHGPAREPDRITLTLESGTMLTVDAVLVAAGRKSTIEGLNLSAAGVAAGDRGIVHVDEHGRTNVPDIYAAGDVIGFPTLASTSMEQARRAVRHALGKDARSETQHLLPHGIYTIPEVSMVGDAEESLKRRGVDYVVGRALLVQRPRPDHRRQRRVPQAPLPPRGHEARGRACPGRAGHRGRPHRDDGHARGATAETFDEACFNLPTLGTRYKPATYEALVKVLRSGAWPL